MKYIVMTLADKEEIFVFPRTVDHDRMFEACESIRFGDSRNWNRKYRDGECVAAGFIDNGQCHGRSETLAIKSRGEKDSKLLAEFNRPAAKVSQEEAAQPAAQPPAQSEQDRDADPDRYLNEEDFADLFRFNECCEDSGADGHDVPKSRMKRLEELGVVRTRGFGRHELTAFGSFVIETTFLQNPRLPLKTIEEHNADAAMQAQKKEAGNAEHN